MVRANALSAGRPRPYPVRGPHPQPRPLYGDYYEDLWVERGAAYYDYEEPERRPGPEFEEYGEPLRRRPGPAEPYAVPEPVRRPPPPPPQSAFYDEPSPIPGTRRRPPPPAPLEERREYYDDYAEEAPAWDDGYYDEAAPLPPPRRRVAPAPYDAPRPQPPVDYYDDYAPPPVPEYAQPAPREYAPPPPREYAPPPREYGPPPPREYAPPPPREYAPPPMREYALLSPREYPPLRRGPPLRGHGPRPLPPPAAFGGPPAPLMGPPRVPRLSRFVSPRKPALYTAKELAFMHGGKVKPMILPVIAKQKRKKKNYAAIIKVMLSKPWVTDALKDEINKKYELLATARATDKEAEWKAYVAQKEKVVAMNETLRLEYIGLHPEYNPDFPFYCESCDRGFPTALKYNSHRAEHVVCGLDKCTFSAHPKIVQRHISMQHQSGLFERISRGYSPEEIKKWIEDRKRNYPTQQNVERKMARKTEMTNRGERYHDNRNEKSNWRGNCRTNNGINRVKNHHEKSADRNHRTRPKRRGIKVRETMPTFNDDDEMHPKIPQFRGIGFYDDCVDLVSDDDRTNNEEIKLNSEGSNYFNLNDEVEHIHENGVEMDSYEKLNITSEVGDVTQAKIDEEHAKIESTHDRISSSLDMLKVYGSDESDDEAPEECSSKLGCSTVNLDGAQNCPKECNDKLENSILNKLDDDDGLDEAPVECSSKLRSNAEDLGDAKNCPKECSSKLENSLFNKLDDDHDLDEAPVECSSKPETSKVDLDGVQNCPKECSSKLESNILNKLDDDRDLDIMQQKITDRLQSRLNEEDANSTWTDKAKSLNDNVEEINDLNSSDLTESLSVNDKDEKINRSRKRKHKNNEEKAEPADPKKPVVLPYRRRYRPPTLLEKLLQPEIKHERNFILQCVHYVVENNYFGIGQSKD